MMNETRCCLLAQKKKHSNISQCLLHETCHKIVTTSLIMAVFSKVVVLFLFCTDFW